MCESLDNSVLRDVSPVIRRHADKIVQSANGKPIIDVGCGTGRNAVLFAGMGYEVVCLDRDLTPLTSRIGQKYSSFKNQHLLLPVQIDLLLDTWPIPELGAGGIICVHLLLPSLFPVFARSLIPGAYLILETVAGHGGNYLELPEAGELRDKLSCGFELEFYKEKRVGPVGQGAVTVALLGKRRSHLSSNHA
jgi:SAM-dependent methyltransferase